jgi:hypothetical protein
MCNMNDARVLVFRYGIYIQTQLEAVQSEVQCSNSANINNTCKTYYHRSMQVIAIVTTLVSLVREFFFSLFILLSC